MQFKEFDWLSGHGITLGSRGYFFLIDTGGSRRSRVNAEEKKIFYFFLLSVNAASPRTISIDKKKISSGTQGTMVYEL